LETRFSGRKQNQIIYEQQTIDLAVSNRGTLVDLTALVYPVYVNYEKERIQNALLPETNAHMEWLCLLTVDTNTYFWLAVEIRNGKQQLTINAILLQNLPKLISRNPVKCFFEVNKAFLLYSQDFSKNSFRVKI